MNKLFLAAGCVLFLLACNSVLDVNRDREEETLENADSLHHTHPETLITDDDIKTFNVTTREITFTTSTVKDNLMRSRYVSFQLKAELLFDSIEIEFPIYSYPFSDLVLSINDFVAPKFYLYDSSPDVSNWPEDGFWAFNKADVLANIQNRKPAMEKFINYLDYAEKIEGKNDSDSDTSSSIVNKHGKISLMH